MTTLTGPFCSTRALGPIGIGGPARFIGVALDVGVHLTRSPLALKPSFVKSLWCKERGVT